MLKLSYSTLLNMYDNMDLRIGCFFIESLRRDERHFVTTFTKQRAGRLLRILSYSVSSYLCNCIWGVSTGTNRDVFVATSI